MTESEMEEECIQVQADVLEQLGVKREIVEYYKKTKI